MSNPFKPTELPASPYPGIEPFSYAYRDLFFAREAETRTLIQQIVLYRGVLLYSSSGMGKSSLINAGLIPLARIEGFQPERIRIQPQNDEEIVIERISYRSEGKLSILPSIFSNSQNLQRVILSIDAFTEMVNQQANSAQTLLIFDQFEEWITLFEEGTTGHSAETTRKSQRKILETIARLINHEKLPVKILIALREDYLAKLAPFFEHCPHLLDHYLRLMPLKSNQIHRVIRGPFEKYPQEFYPQFSTALSENIQQQFEERSKGTEVRLTEVQIVCKSLYEVRENGASPEQLFLEQGGVKGILEQYLENTLQALQPEQQDAAIGLLSRMVTPAGTRNVIARDDLLKRIELEERQPQNLLTETLDNLYEKTKLVRRERRREVYYYELTSEFLIDWISKKAYERQQVAQQQKLEEMRCEAAKQKERAEQQAKIVRRMNRLAFALTTVLIFAVSMAFYAWKQREKAEKHEQLVRIKAQEALRGKQRADSLLVITNQAKEEAIAARNRADSLLENTKLAWQEALKAKEAAERERLRAERQHRFSFSRELAVAALNNLNVDPERSVLLARQALLITQTFDDTVLAEVKDAFHRAVQTSRIRLSLEGHQNWVTAIDFSPDGDRLASTSRDGTAKIWDVESGQELLTFRGHTGPVKGIAFSPDGIHVATVGADRLVKLWEAATGKELLTLAGHTDHGKCVTFSPDGMRLATTGLDRTARLWDLITGKEIFTLTGHSDWVTVVAFSPDGTRLATSSVDGTAKLWDINTGKELHTFFGHTGGIWSLAFSPDGKSLATTSWDRTVKLWDVSSGRVLHILTGHTNGVLGVAFGPEGNRLATVSLDNTAKLWDITSGLEICTLSGHQNWIYDVTFSPNGKYLATAGKDCTIKLWYVGTGQKLLTLPGQNNWIYDLCFSPDGKRLVTVGKEGIANLWNIRTGEMLLPITDETSLISAIAFSPDGKYLASAHSDGTAELWDADTGLSISTFQGHQDKVSGIAFHPAGHRLATASYDHTAKVWDVFSARELFTLTGHTDKINYIVYSADGNLLATASWDGTVRVWDANTGEPMLGKTIENSSPEVLRVLFSPDGTRLAISGFERTAKIWDIKTGRQLLTLSGHSGWITSMAFSPDGSRIVTGSHDRTARMWDASSGRELLTLSGHIDAIYAVAFSPDGHQLATGSRDQTVRIYELNIDDLMVRAHLNVTRSLTAEECQKYLHTSECLQTALDWVIAGKQLARQGQVDSASHCFHEALSLEPQLKLDPETDG